MSTAAWSAPGARALVVGGIAAAAVVTGGVVFGLASGSPDLSGAMLVTPILVLVTLPLLWRQAEREGDRRLFWLLFVALMAKLAGAVANYLVAFDLYGGVADARLYQEHGTLLAGQFRTGDFDTGLPSLSGTNFMFVLAGTVFTLIGTSPLGGFLVFSWMGFIGLFLFYRAFVMAVPEGKARAYLPFVFFLPSLLFWPSSIGKEAWMLLSLGVMALGAAHLFSHRGWRGAGLSALGLWMALTMRPHVAALAAVALAVGFVVGRPRRSTNPLAPVGRLLVAAGLVAVSFLAVREAQTFLEQSAVETEQGVIRVLEQTTERTQIGGSEFNPSILESPGRAPIAVITVLYRPLIMEAHNLQSAAAALEGTFLLVLTVVRFRWLMAAIRSIRRQPYVALALAYTGLFILAFSSFANFGLLARERVQLLPFFIVLLSVPPRTEAQELELRAGPQSPSADVEQL